MQETIVLYPGVGVGHLNPMVVLADHFLRRGLAVTVLLIEPLLDRATFDTAVQKAIANNPSISFHVLTPPDSDSAAGSDVAVDPRLSTNYINSFNSSLLSFLRSKPTVVAVILDFFRSGAIDVVHEAGIPGYVFYASGGVSMAAILHWAHLYPEVNLDDHDENRLHWPGVPPFRAYDFLHEARNEVGAQRIVRPFRRFPDVDGILLNTFESLEPGPVAALRVDGSCIPGRSVPPVYCVGPVIGKGDPKREGAERHECLAWLDKQPERSVVFLCYGSQGSHSAEQWRELAVGLERSGHRFLFVTRAPKGPDFNSRMQALNEPDLDAILPEGFLERTKGKGFVVKKWAPQVEVLNHPATGAFVTHCGWNSALEGITSGLPLLCHPLYAEQRLNKVFLVEALLVGVELRGYDKYLVPAGELEEKIKFVMESGGGKEMRERVAAARERAAAALREGGSSSIAVEHFLTDLKKAKSSIAAGN